MKFKIGDVVWYYNSGRILDKDRYTIRKGIIHFYDWREAQCHITYEEANGVDDWSTTDKTIIYDSADEIHTFFTENEAKISVKRDIENQIQSLKDRIETLENISNSIHIESERDNWLCDGKQHIVHCEDCRPSCNDNNGDICPHTLDHVYTSACEESCHECYKHKCVERK